MKRGGSVTLTWMICRCSAGDPGGHRSERGREKHPAVGADPPAAAGAAGRSSIAAGRWGRRMNWLTGGGWRWCCRTRCFSMRRCSITWRWGCASAACRGVKSGSGWRNGWSAWASATWRDAGRASFRRGSSDAISLARALALQPELLLLDEPFSALDAPTRARLLEDFHVLLSELSVTTVFITHDLDEALYLGDRVAVVLGGRLRQCGPPRGRSSAPRPIAEVAAFVGVETVISGRVATSTRGCWKWKSGDTNCRRWARHSRQPGSRLPAPRGYHPATAGCKGDGRQQRPQPPGGAGSALRPAGGSPGAGGGGLRVPGGGAGDAPRLPRSWAWRQGRR